MATPARHSAKTPGGVTQNTRDSRAAERLSLVTGVRIGTYGRVRGACRMGECALAHDLSRHDALKSFLRAAAIDPVKLDFDRESRAHRDGGKDRVAFPRKQVSGQPGVRLKEHIRLVGHGHRLEMSAAWAEVGHDESPTASIDRQQLSGELSALLVCPFKGGGTTSEISESFRCIRDPFERPVVGVAEVGDGTVTSLVAFLSGALATVAPHLEAEREQDGHDHRGQRDHVASLHGGTLGQHGGSWGRPT